MLVLFAVAVGVPVAVVVVVVNVVVANSRKKSSIRSCLSFYADADYSCRNEMPEFGCIDADDIQAASDSIKKKQDHAHAHSIILE